MIRLAEILRRERRAVQCVGFRRRLAAASPQLHGAKPIQRRGHRGNEVGRWPGGRSGIHRRSVLAVVSRSWAPVAVWVLTRDSAVVSMFVERDDRALRTAGQIDRTPPRQSLSYPSPILPNTASIERGCFPCATGPLDRRGLLSSHSPSARSIRPNFPAPRDIRGRDDHPWPGGLPFCLTQTPPPSDYSARFTATPGKNREEYRVQSSNTPSSGRIRVRPIILESGKSLCPAEVCPGPLAVGWRSVSLRESPNGRQTQRVRHAFALAGSRTPFATCVIRASR